LSAQPDYPALLGTATGAVIAIRLLAWGIGAGSRSRTHITPSSHGTATIDVTEQAANTRRLALRTRATQAAGGVIVTMGLVPFVWPVGLLLVPVGVFVAVTGTTYFRRRVALVRTRSVTRSWWRRICATLLGLTSVLVALAAVLAVIGSAFAGMASTHGTDKKLALDDGQTSASSLNSAFLAIGLGLLAVAILGYRWARRVAHADAREVIAADDRPVVVYLRSFADDRVRIPTGASPRRPLLESLSLRPTERFEEVVAAHLASVGPVVAISDPDGPGRQLGAARTAMSAHTDEWKSQVIQWLSAARLVVVTAGTTEGLRWELEQVAALGNGKSVFLLPPAATPALRARGAHLFQTLVQADVWPTPPIDVDTTLAIAFDRDRSLHAISGDRRDEACYQEALIAAVNLLETKPTTITSGPAAPPLGRSAARRLDRLVVVGAAVLAGLSVVAAGELAPAPDSAADVRQQAKDAIVNELIKDKYTEPQASCITNEFVDELDDDEIEQLYDVGLSDAEAARLRDIAAQCR
jgi:hypothetical protein